MVTQNSIIKREIISRVKSLEMTVGRSYLSVRAR